MIRDKSKDQSDTLSATQVAEQRFLKAAMSVNPGGRLGGDKRRDVGGRQREPSVLEMAKQAAKEGRRTISTPAKIGEVPADYQRVVGEDPDDVEIRRLEKLADGNVPQSSTPVDPGTPEPGDTEGVNEAGSTIDLSGFDPNRTYGGDKTQAPLAQLQQNQAQINQTNAQISQQMGQLMQLFQQVQQGMTGFQQAIQQMAAQNQALDANTKAQVAQLMQQVEQANQQMQAMLPPQPGEQGGPPQAAPQPPGPPPPEQAAPPPDAPPQGAGGGQEQGPPPLPPPDPNASFLPPGTMGDSGPVAGPATMKMGQFKQADAGTQPTLSPAAPELETFEEMTDLHPMKVKDVADKLLGQEWPGWEPETTFEMFKRALGQYPEEKDQNLLMGIRALIVSPAYWTMPMAFEKISLALNGMIPDVREQEEYISPAQMAFAVSIAKQISPFVQGDVAPFSSDVVMYIAVRLHEHGMVLAAPPFEAAQQALSGQFQDVSVTPDMVQSKLMEAIESQGTATLDSDNNPVDQQVSQILAMYQYLSLRDEQYQRQSSALGQ